MPVTLTALPNQLAGPPLSDREAVADVCYASFAAIDFADEALFVGACAPDIHTNINGRVCDGIEELKRRVFENAGRRLDTVHYLTNMRVSVDSDSDSSAATATATARVTFAAQAVHCRPGQGGKLGVHKWTTGAVYSCVAAKYDGVWKLKEMESNHLWAEGDPSVMHHEQ
ncbi:hypothetical protein F4778DRAFT_794308 [Xylariomycetidae sp. FL2044]|nr:hypothetical protein F4778DRAFT_794308 [Xylariomycetidae sp. FL2044]